MWKRRESRCAVRRVLCRQPRATNSQLRNGRRIANAAAAANPINDDRDGHRALFRSGVSSSDAGALGAVRRLLRAEFPVIVINHGLGDAVQWALTVLRFQKYRQRAIDLAMRMGPYMAYIGLCRDSLALDRDPTAFFWYSLIFDLDRYESGHVFADSASARTRNYAPLEVPGWIAKWKAAWAWQRITHAGRNLRQGSRAPQSGKRGNRCAFQNAAARSPPAVKPLAQKVNPSRRHMNPRRNPSLRRG